MAQFYANRIPDQTGKSDRPPSRGANRYAGLEVEAQPSRRITWRRPESVW